MIRGTTPEHTFAIPFDESLIEKVMVIYAQDDVEVFRKDTEKCEISGKSVTVKLTQEETLKLDHRRPVQIQVRIRTVDGTALASNEVAVSVGKCLNNEVM